jgi:hypothetical protein
VANASASDSSCSAKTRAQTSHNGALASSS